MSGSSHSGSSDPGPTDPSAVLHGAESAFVVEAVDALLRDDVAGARTALVAASSTVGWAAVAHRLDVAGRGLAIDAGYCDGEEEDVVVLLAEVDTASLAAGSTVDASLLMSRWCSPHTTATELPKELVWPAAGVVAWLIERAGYPAEVVA